MGRLCPGFATWLQPCSTWLGLSLKIPLHFDRQARQEGLLKKRTKTKRPSKRCPRVRNLLPLRPRHPPCPFVALPRQAKVTRNPPFRLAEISVRVVEYAEEMANPSQGNKVLDPQKCYLKIAETIGIRSSSAAPLTSLNTSPNKASSTAAAKPPVTRVKPDLRHASGHPAVPALADRR